MGAAHDAGTLTARAVKARLREREDPARAAGEASFFKTGPGQYGEGDQFLGLSVPEQRRVAKQHRELPFVELAALLRSPTHEDRFTALEILVMQYETGDAKTREGVFRFYLQHTDRINNWDLVDTSARYIVGEHLRDRSRARVYRLARSRNLWERRIAMVATHAWIAGGDTADAYAIADLLLDDTHDLIRKAVGWMLREAGVHDRAALLRFLRTHYARVARTTLRYAIEHLPVAQRKRILAGNIAT